MNIIKQAKELIDIEEYEQAMELLLPLAQQGESESQYLLGYLYFTSADVTREASIEWLRKAVAQDHPEACYHLSMLSNTDSGCEQVGPPTDEASWELLHRAAQLGSAGAQRDLGCCYARGDSGLEKDEIKGRYWYTKAAEQGHSDAQYNLSTMLLEGEGGLPDNEQAIHWLSISAGKDDDPMCICAAGLLADIYEAGLYGILPDPIAAQRWRQRKEELDIVWQQKSN